MHHQENISLSLAPQHLEIIIAGLNALTEVGRFSIQDQAFFHQTVIQFKDWESEPGAISSAFNQDPANFVYIVVCLRLSLLKTLRPQALPLQEDFQGFYVPQERLI